MVESEEKNHLGRIRLRSLQQQQNASSTDRWRLTSSRNAGADWRGGTSGTDTHGTDGGDAGTSGTDARGTDGGDAGTSGHGAAAAETEETHAEKQRREEMDEEDEEVN